MHRRIATEINVPVERRFPSVRSIDELGSYGSGTSRSLQIFRARYSLISRCLGTVVVLRAARLTKTVCLATFAKQFAAVFLKVTNKLQPLHATGSGSRMTS